MRPGRGAGDAGDLANKAEQDMAATGTASPEAQHGQRHGRPQRLQLSRWQECRARGEECQEIKLQSWIETGW